MSSPIRLLQDVGQFNAGQRGTGGRLLQDQKQYAESQPQRDRAEAKRREQLEKMRIADEIREQKKIEAALAKITPVPVSLKRSETTRKIWKAREDEIKAVRKSNLAAYASIGITPVPNFLSRSAADIMKGEQAGDGKDATVQRQVALARLNLSLQSGKRLYTKEEFTSTADKIKKSSRERALDEKRHRTARSVAKAQGKAAQGVQQNFIAGSQFSVQSAPVTRHSSGELIKPTKITYQKQGAGTSSDPFRGTQPNKAFVAPYILAHQSRTASARASGSPSPGIATSQDGSFIGYSPSGEPVQGAPSLKDLSTVGYSPDGKPIQGPPRPQENASFVGVVGSLQYAYGKQDEKIFDDKRYDDLGLAAQAGFGNALRYADAVDSGEVPKPEGLQWLNYYASKGLKPIVDIPLSIDELVRGTDHKIQPTLADKIIGVPIDLVTKGKTETHDPVGDYIRKDPLGAAVQLPAEAALWVTGGKAVTLATKGVKAVTPVKYVAPKIDGTVAYRGITIQNKPIIGIQNNRIVIGNKPANLPLDKIKLEGRSGGELALGFGGEKGLFYSQKTLQHMKDVGFLDDISIQRAQAAINVEKQTHSRGINFVGEVGKDPFKSVSSEQGDFLLRKTASLQTKGEIETVHGSIATRIQVDPKLRAMSGEVLKMGDLDVVPKLTSKQIKRGATLEQRASTLIKEYADEFPLRKGETIKVTDKVGSNRELILNKPGGAKEKVFEIVMKKSDEAPIGLSKKDPTHILDYKIPFGKTVKATDYNITTKTLEYQGLTQTKTILAFQKNPTGISKAVLYPARGREKDIVRRYWQARQSELNQRRAGRIFQAAKTRQAAEKFKSLYPDVPFGESFIAEEKVALSLSTKSGSTGTSIRFGNVSGGDIILGATTAKSSGSVFDHMIKQQRRDAGLSSKITSAKTPGSKVTGSKVTGSRAPGSRAPGSRVPSKAPSIRPPSKAPSIRPPSKAPSIRPPSRITSPGGSTSIGGKGGRVGSRFSAFNTNPTDPFRGKKKPKLFPLIDAINTTKKKKGKVKKPHDFLGNVRLHHIEGFIKRTEVIHGDRRLPRQIQKDKKLGFRESKTSIF